MATELKCMTAERACFVANVLKDAGHRVQWEKSNPLIIITDNDREESKAIAKATPGESPEWELTEDILGFEDAREEPPVALDTPDPVPTTEDPNVAELKAEAPTRRVPAKRRVNPDRVRRTKKEKGNIMADGGVKAYRELGGLHVERKKLLKSVEHLRALVADLANFEARLVELEARRDSILETIGLQRK